MEEIAECDTWQDNLTRYTTERPPAIAIEVVLRAKTATHSEVEVVAVVAISDYTRPIVAAAANEAGATGPVPTIYEIDGGVLDIAIGTSSET